MKLQLKNVGEATIVVKDPHGYSYFVAEVAGGDTARYDITEDVLQRVAPQLKEFETGIIRATDGTVLVGLEWAVFSETDQDIRTAEEGVCKYDGAAMLPLLLEFGAVSIPDAGGTDLTITGTGLLGSQVQAHCHVVEGTATMTLTAVKPGVEGNLISCVIATPAGGGPNPAVAVAGNKITVTPKTGGNTVAEIVSVINADSDALKLVQAATTVGGNITLAQPEQFLIGGVGPGVSLIIGSKTATLTSVTDTVLTFDLAASAGTSTYPVNIAYRCGPHLAMMSAPMSA